MDARPFNATTKCCRRKCHEKINVEQQEELYTEYRALSDYNKQSIYIHGCISCVKPKRLQTVVLRRNRRAAWHYSFKRNGNVIFVCQFFFRRVLGVTKKRLEILQEKIFNADDLNDKRGKHKNRPNKVDRDAWVLLSVFCKTLPHQKSHYGSGNNERFYFTNPQLTMHKVYDLFVDYFEAVTGRELNVAFNTFQMYFNRHIPFGFKLPRSDVCNKCFEYESKSNHTAEETVSMKLHKKKVEAYKHLKAEIMEKAGKTALVLEFDYAQNLPLPKLPVNEQFYKRLLWLHIFNVHVHGVNKSYMYHFVEGESKKGANSVCSFVRDVIMKEKQTFRDVFLLSDGCTGQNRNWVVVSVLSALAKDEKMNITHVFPVRGHSYCQCDRNFGLYSRAVKKMETVESVDDYLDIIRSSKKKGGPFVVRKCVVRDFEKHTKIRKQGKIKISKSVVLQYSSSGDLVSHENYAQATPESVRIVHLSKKKLLATPPAPAVPIAAAKVADVKSLLRYLSTENRKYYVDYFKTADVKNSDSKCSSNKDSDADY